MNPHPVMAMEAVCEHSACPVTAMEAVSELLPCSEPANETISELSSRSESALEADCLDQGSATYGTLANSEGTQRDNRWLKTAC